jgi:hypothetical protein
MKTEAVGFFEVLLTSLKSAFSYMPQDSNIKYPPHTKTQDVI